jgi:hypothetical protein
MTELATESFMKMKEYERFLPVLFACPGRLLPPILSNGQGFRWGSADQAENLAAKIKPFSRI